MEVADIVFVPVFFPYNPDTNPDLSAYCTEFFTQYVPDNFPALSIKPHVIFASSYSLNWGKHRCWDHDMFNNFTVLTIEPYVSGWQHDFSHCVGVPMMAHVHNQHLLGFSKGSQNLSAVEVNKHRLVFSSFVVRDFPTRFAAHKHCLGSPNLCKHENVSEWVSNLESLLPKVQKGFEESWFTLMPHADFKLRNSLFDALLAPSIPVVFDTDFAKYMPFSDILDYSRILAVIDEDLFVRDGRNLIDLIHETFFDRRVEMIEYLLSIRHLFQYKLYPHHHLLNIQTRDVIDVNDDAFTFSMKRLLANLCKRNLLDEEKCGKAAPSASYVNVK